MEKYKNSENANYDFSKQKEPAHRMGSGSFANLPEKSFIKSLPKAPCYRGGNVDSFTNDLSKVTGIDENSR
ncbi:hypothetical protein HC928_02720 [bacterium]|nr:hypothetical protein [bacterium]